MIRAFLGGSFDPVHVGHTAMARFLLAAHLADVVHVVPAWLSPHKSGTAASAAHRLAMVHLAFPAGADLIIDPREIDGGRACFTVDTLASLQIEYGDSQWLLVIGGDHLGTIHRWHEPSRLQEIAEIVVLGRDGFDLGAKAIRAAGLDPQRVRCLPEFEQPVSSTAVRAMVDAGPVPVSYLVAAGIAPAVANYIVEHRLYLPDWNGENCVPDSD